MKNYKRSRSSKGFHKPPIPQSSYYNTIQFSDACPVHGTSHSHLHTLDDTLTRLQEQAHLPQYALSHSDISQVQAPENQLLCMNCEKIIVKVHNLIK